MFWRKKKPLPPPPWLAPLEAITAKLDEVSSKLSQPLAVPNPVPALLSVLKELDAIKTRPDPPAPDFTPIIERLMAIGEQLHSALELLSALNGVAAEHRNILSSHSEHLKDIVKKPVILQVDATVGQHRRYAA